MAGVDGAKAVNGLTQRVDDSTKHLAADGDVHDAAGGADLVTLLDGVDLAEQNGANLALVQVLGEAIHAAASGRAGELQQLAGHGGLQAGDVRDAVADLDDDRRLLLVNSRVDLGQLLAQRAQDLGGADLVCHCSSLPI